MKYQGGNKQRPNYWQWRRSFILGDSKWNFSKSVTLWLLAILQQLTWRSAHMCTWFSAYWRRFRYNRKCLFSCIYNPLITISPTSLFSANSSGNRVKNHPQPWTCSLRLLRSCFARVLTTEPHTKNCFQCFDLTTTADVGGQIHEWATAAPNHFQFVKWFSIFLLECRRL